MAEYIDREKLLQDIEQSVVFSARTGTVSAEMRGARKVVERIRRAPAILIGIDTGCSVDDCVADEEDDNG